MDDEYNIWIGFPRYSAKYARGVKAFLGNAFPNLCVGDEMKCPCKNCEDRKWHRKDAIFSHLICSGPSPLHVKWICEVSQTNVRGISNFMDGDTRMDFGDNLDTMFNCDGKKFENLDDCEDRPNAEAKRFYRHIEEGKQSLYPGCINFSRLSFLIKLYHLKCVHGISESAFGELLKLIKEAFPDADLPLSFNAILAIGSKNYYFLHFQLVEKLRAHFASRGRRVI
ncbi:hypothetical protein OROMI_008809 [Orobanche minor]